MNYLLTQLDNKTVQTICDKIREEILDKVQFFDYTVFEHFKPEDQTTVQRINVDVKNNVLTLSRVLKFDYIDNNYDPYSYPSHSHSVRQINVDFIIRVLPKSGKVISITIELGMNGGTASSVIVFSLYVGDEKFLINDDFYERETFEGHVFQQSTVDKAEPFGLDYVLEIIQKLKV